MLFLITAVVAIALYFKLRNKQLNQILYFIMVIELFLFIIGQNMIILAFIILSFAIILYPILFFLERFIDFIKHIGKRVIHFFRWLIDGIIRLYFAVVNWIEKHIKLVLSLMGLTGAIGMYLIISDIFISGLVFLAIIYYVSPEREKETTQANFGKKLLYRLLVFICLFGTLLSNNIIPLRAWIFTLILLGFFGYVIWAVRKSEEIYHLSMQWRLWSSLIAIIDFLLTIFFILQEYYF